MCIYDDDGCLLFVHVIMCAYEYIAYDCVHVNVYECVYYVHYVIVCIWFCDVCECGCTYMSVSCV